MRISKLLLPALLLLPLAAPATAQQSRPQQRCGWLSNPTPGNYWLNDRHGEWVLSEQGGYQAEGMDNLPDFTTRGWVRTNGSYGYGCACVTGTVSQRDGRFNRIVSARSVPLAQCRADRTLRRPGS